MEYDALARIINKNKDRKTTQGKSHTPSWTVLDRPSVSTPTTLDHGHGSMTTFDPATWLNNLKSISVGDFEKTKSTRFKVKRMHY